MIEESKPRMGIFLCECGGQISKSINLIELSKRVSKIPGIVYTAIDPYPCSKDGQERIRQAIGQGLDRVLIAGCAPRLVEKLFHETVQLAGLDPSFINIANIREQCVFTHSRNIPETFEKAANLIEMGVARLTTTTASLIQTGQIVKSVLVVGSGLSALTVAISLADNGFKTTLFEQSNSLTDYFPDQQIKTRELTLERAMELKKAGLKGMAVSLDHFDPVKHNKFRGCENSFEWVIKAVENAHKAGLVVIFLLCPTKEFTNYDNLIKYAGFVRRLGAAFILLIEPRAVGRFAKKNVSLTREQELILEEFYLKMNYSREFIDMPAVSYHGYHQRRIGCFGSGSRYLYVDTNGEVHLCPFCRQQMGNVLDPDIDNSLKRMKKAGCHKYKHADI